jgi:hypothetical protein
MVALAAIFVLAEIGALANESNEAIEVFDASNRSVQSIMDGGRNSKKPTLSWPSSSTSTTLRLK